MKAPFSCRGGRSAAAALRRCSSRRCCWPAPAVSGRGLQGAPSTGPSSSPPGSTRRRAAKASACTRSEFRGSSTDQQQFCNKSITIVPAFIIVLDGCGGIWNRIVATQTCRAGAEFQHKYKNVNLLNVKHLWTVGLKNTTPASKDRQRGGFLRAVSFF